MFSYVWWAMRGFPSDTNSGAADADNSLPADMDDNDCYHHLHSLRSEESAMTESLDVCVAALMRARRQKQAIEEGYEALIMSTYDPLEHPVVARCSETDGPLFNVTEGALQRVQREESDVDEDDDDLSDASEFSDEDINRALRPRGTAAIIVPTVNKAAKDASQRKRRLVADLGALTSADFTRAEAFEQWREYLSVWQARITLLSKATRYEVLGKVEEECELLDERLFELRIRLSTIRAKQRRAEFQMDTIAENTTHNEPPMTASEELPSPPISVEVNNV